MYRFAVAVAGYLSSIPFLAIPDTAAHAQQAAPTAVAVGTVAAERRPIERCGVLVGRVEAVERVEVRARVTGYLEEVLFKEGDMVKEGAPLYRIEKGLFEAAVTSAEAALERSKAAKTLSDIQLKRAQELLDRNSGTVCREIRRWPPINRPMGRSWPTSQPGNREDQPRLHLDQLTYHRKSRQDQHHQGQCRRSQQWRADDDRQPGSDVCQLPGKPAGLSRSTRTKGEGRSRSRSGSVFRTGRI